MGGNSLETESCKDLIEFLFVLEKTNWWIRSSLTWLPLLFVRSGKIKQRNKPITSATIEFARRGFDSLHLHKIFIKNKT